MLYFFLIILSINLCSAIQDLERPFAPKANKKSFTSLVFSSNLPPQEVYKKSPCQWLHKLKHHSRICAKRRGLPETLLEARKFAISQCEETFQYNQWNCSSRGTFMKKLYRETALLHAMASSAVVFAVAKACSEGTLAGCKCGEPGQRSANASVSGPWQWGGCGYNTKYAKKFTSKLLQLHKKGDPIQTIVKYNMEVGVRVAVESADVACRCHGISGTCTMRVCWRIIRPFSFVAKQLKNLYHSAIQVQSQNNVRAFVQERKKRKLMYMDDTDNLCATTVNRPCRDTDNCATLCCGREFYPYTYKVVQQCHCSWRKDRLYEVDCQRCTKNQTGLRCS